MTGSAANVQTQKLRHQWPVSRRSECFAYAKRHGASRIVAELHTFLHPVEERADIVRDRRHTKAGSLLV
jgi:hypothetical protein